MPWPANAASPWRRTGSTRLGGLAVGPERSCLARTRPRRPGRRPRGGWGSRRPRGGRRLPARERRVVVAPGGISRRPAAGQLGIDVPRNSEKIARPIADDVGEDVEAPAVRHADHDLVDAAGRRRPRGAVEERDRGLAALEREAPLPQEAACRGNARRPRRRSSFSRDPPAELAGRGFPAVAAAMRSRIQYFSVGLEMWRYSVPILPQ